MAPEARAGDEALRASDQERERVAALLREHAGEGRLEVDELAERLDRAYAARTRGDLTPLTDDLPDVPSRSPRSRSRRLPRELVDHAGAFVAVNLVLVAIWALTGAGYFWPVWPILGWGVGIASHASEGLFGVRFPCAGPCGRRRSGHRAAA